MPFAKPAADRRRTSLWEIYRHLPARRRWQSVAVLGLMFAGALAEVATLGSLLPFLSILINPAAGSHGVAVKALLGGLGSRDPHDLVFSLALLLCAVAVAAAIIRITLLWATQKLIFRMGFDLGVEVYRKTLSKPYAYHLENSPTIVTDLINKVQVTTLAVMLPALQAMIALFMAFFILASILIINFRIALVLGISFGIFYAIVVGLARKRFRANSLIVAQAHRDRIQIIQEGLGGIRDVIIRGKQRFYVGRFAEADGKLRDAQAQSALIVNSPRFVLEGVSMVLVVCLVLYLMRQDGGVVASLPALGVMALGSQRLLPLVQQVYNGWSSYMSSHASLDDVLRALDEPQPREHLAPPHAPIRLESLIRLENLSFSYGDQEHPVIRDLSMEIRKGARIGLIGPTGCGKTTLTDLILGLLTPTAGRILVDGTPLDESNVVAWRRSVTHVPQSIYLTDASVSENIAFGVPASQIDHARVRRAAEKAGIANFIEAHPSGYDLVVGDRGVRLSGGQRQRIGIARALYDEAEVIVFDEATSALDDATERAVTGALEQLGDAVTLIMVAHRLSTLSICDTVFRLDAGRLVESGSFQEVIGSRAASS